MKTLFTPSSSQTVVNRSKFLTTLVPYSDFEGLQEKLKKEHPKANHVVYAVRYLNEYDQIVENSSDDGEPKGCAGVPALNVLRGAELIDVAVLIVRYFGGIKLGTGGMARVYAQAVKDVVAQSELIVYEKCVTHTFVTDYSSIDKTLYALKQYGITKIERKYGVNEVVWSIVASQERIERWKEE
ncbi:FIG000605: protein co-occurring with transport systems (COG1739) [hydrothermal vent metagenome]|uniref:FIG000605: protein co-occurring with transport systems (COG1739) n=1 Tax=hydrothermal vent metagenome TaxID=652676 RepID=A0A1W1E7L4_9ZZZZ